jgi:hypothetical protein
MAAQKMTDTDDGGGRMSSNEIPDAVIGNLFPSISRLDRIYGRVKMLKIFPFVYGANTSPLAGSHLIMKSVATDPKVNHLIMSGTATDVRLTAEGRVEAFITQSSESSLYMWGTHLAGSRLIKTWSTLDPAIGNVYILKEMSGSTVVSQENILITSFTKTTETVTDAQGDFTKTSYVLTLSRALVYTYSGLSPTRTTPSSYNTKIFLTTVNDSGRYYGLSSLIATANIGDLAIKTASVYGQLLPSSVMESPLIGISAGVYDVYIPISGTNEAIPFWYGSASPNLGTNTNNWSHWAIVPGSLKFGSSSVYVDTTLLGVNQSGGGYIIALGSKGIDYKQGYIQGDTIGGGWDNIHGQFAVAASLPKITQIVPITIANRGYTYPLTLNPPPMANSLSISFRALSKNYFLADDGAGHIKGVGSLSYGSGTLSGTNCVITLGALPDIDSSLVISYCESTMYSATIPSTIAAPIVSGNITNTGSKPFALSACSFSWVSSGATKTATVSSTGVISGSNVSDGQLTANGAFWFRPIASTYPDLNSTLTITAPHYTNGGTVACSSVGGYINQMIGLDAALVYSGNQINLNGTNLQSGTVSLTLYTNDITGNNGIIYTYRDDGNGNIFFTKGSSNTQVGTINYTTGIVTLSNLPITSTFWAATYDQTTGHVTAYTQTTTTQYITNVDSKYSSAGTGTTANTITLTIDKLYLDLSPGVIAYPVPRSVGFTWKGDTWSVSELGIIRRGLQTGGANTNTYQVWDYPNVGTMSATGKCIITAWSTDSGAFAMKYLLTATTQQKPTKAVNFQIGGTPIRPTSIYVQGTRADTGGIIFGQSQQGGTITGDINGYADYTNGVVRATSSYPLISSTCFYNAVVLVNIPLDKSTLGIDSLTLPSNGKVPIFRVGDTVVIHKTNNTTIATPTQGTTYTLPSTQLDSITAVDGSNNAITNITTSLTDGTIIFNDASPPTAIVTYDEAEMRVVSDVQIDGTVSVAMPLTKQFSSGSSLSTALIYGDMFAREYLHFMQTTWASTWSDTTTGTPTAAYNFVNYPVILTNTSAIDERWALVFTSSSGGNILGESVGQIGTFTTAVNVAPSNPVMGGTYFTLDYHGFGSGYSSGNCIRFNTKGSHTGTWIIESIAIGAQMLASDGFKLQFRGDYS